MRSVVLHTPEYMRKSLCAGNLLSVYLKVAMSVRREGYERCMLFRFDGTADTFLTRSILSSYRILPIMATLDLHITHYLKQAADYFFAALCMSLVERNNMAVRRPPCQQTKNEMPFYCAHPSPLLASLVSTSNRQCNQPRAQTERVVHDQPWDR